MGSSPPWRGVTEMTVATWPPTWSLVPRLVWQWTLRAVFTLATTRETAFTKWIRTASTPSQQGTISTSVWGMVTQLLTRLCPNLDAWAWILWAICSWPTLAMIASAKWTTRALSPPAPERDSWITTALAVWRVLRPGYTCSIAAHRLGSGA